MIAIFPKIANLAARNDYENLTCLIRKYYGKDEVYSPDLDMELIFKSIGIGISYLKLDTRAALIAKDESGRFQISAVLNDERWGRFEQKVTLAHLLGHYLLHVEPSIARGELNRIGFKEDISPIERFSLNLAGNGKDTDRREVEADQFAASLLLPQAFIKRASEKISEKDKLAAFFGVPVQLLNYRLQRLGDLKDVESSSYVEKPLTAKSGTPSFKKMADVSTEKNHGVNHNNKDLYVERPQSLQVANRAPLEREPSSLKQIENRFEPNNSTEPPLSKGLAKLRSLARKIDSTVK